MSVSNSTTKRCTVCGEHKPLDDFHLAKKGIHGRASRCKVCLSAWHSINYAERISKDIFEMARRAKESRKWYHGLTKEERRSFMARVKEYRRQLPNAALGKNLRRALRRRPTQNHVTVNELIEIYERQGGKCAISGLTMTWAQEAFTPTSMSIDRMDWREGYTKENVRLVCYAINCFRQRMTDAEMLEMAKAIVANMETRNV